MSEKISKPKSKKILGIGGQNTLQNTIKGDEILPELRGKRAIKKYREMRDNDATIGAVMYAVEQVLRDVHYNVVPANDTEEANREAEFVESVLIDMDHTLDDHISESLSSLTYGFAVFEIVAKRRVGPYEKDPKKRSRFTDGRMGIRKLASRAQWTINRFEVDPVTGDVLGVIQDGHFEKGSNGIYLPSWKILHYKTTSINNDPSGRSILRNAYKSWLYMNNIQDIEAIAIEREMNGIPVGRMPAEYLSENATDEQKAVKKQFERILMGLKANEFAFALLPSDLYTDPEGKVTGERLMDVELIASNGKRDIDMSEVIRRYQHDIARSIMAEFLMLGSANTGSYALSKSKTDLFLRSVESYIQSIFDVLNKQLLNFLWQINGLDYDLMPKIVPGDVAPYDLRELGAYLRNLNGANIDISNQLDIIDNLLRIADLPPLDRDSYNEKEVDNGN